MLAGTNQPTNPIWTILILVPPWKKHLLTAANDRTIPSKFPLRIRQGARYGLDKLEKYKAMADANQYYKLGTGA
jgi:hypothetical protein